MDWFENITGFREDGYEDTRSRLTVEGSCLVSGVNGSKHGIGRFEMPTLGQLRERVQVPLTGERRTTVRCLAGDARALHSAPEFVGAMFQVASQFKLLEMASPNVTPEDGVTRYAHDRTQGPACAIAAGAATIWRNYFTRSATAKGRRPRGNSMRWSGSARRCRVCAAGRCGRSGACATGVPWPCPTA